MRHFGPCACKAVDHCHGSGEAALSVSLLPPVLKFPPPRQCHRQWPPSVRRGRAAAARLRGCVAAAVFASLALSAACAQARFFSHRSHTKTEHEALSIALALPSSPTHPPPSSPLLSPVCAICMHLGLLSLCEYDPLVC